MPHRQTAVIFYRTSAVEYLFVRTSGCIMGRPTQDSAARQLRNSSSQTLLYSLATFGFAFFIYFAEGKDILSNANSKRSVLRALRDNGLDTVGTTVRKDSGAPYYNDSFRLIQDSEEYVIFSVKDKPQNINDIIEIKGDAWGAVSGDVVGIRYLVADPTVAYYTEANDILEAITWDIRKYSIAIFSVWLVVMAPIAFSVFLLLASDKPDAGRRNLLSLGLVIVSFAVLMIYLVW